MIAMRTSWSREEKPNLLDYDSIVPLYEQIMQEIKKDIEKKNYNTKHRLPTEEELAEQYGVSRITIRRAMAELVEQGLVKRKQGKGTFISPPKMHKDLKLSGFSFTELCEANGKIAGAKLLEAGLIPLDDPQVAEWLHIPKGDRALRIQRLRYASGVPCVIEDNYFPKEYVYLLEIDLEHDSLYRYLREEKDIEIVTGEMILRIVKADAKTAKLLEVPHNAPLLRTFGRIFRGDGEVLHVCKQVGYGEDFDFIVR